MDKLSGNLQAGQAYRNSWGSQQAKRAPEVLVSEVQPSGNGRLYRTISDSSDQDDAASQVLGSTDLYENGQIRCIPMPTPDPKDPLNLPTWRKWTAILVLCFFGSLSLAAETVVGSILPVFELEYSGVDPTTVLNDPNLGLKASDPLGVVPEGVTPIPLAQVSLLATAPLIANGIASYFLIPLSLAVGRRPVLLVMSVAAWAGGFWAGASTSLQSHIAARVVHGMGAGAVEALLPLIAQDLFFIHQRAKATSAIFASQGLFIVILGVTTPYLSVHYTWRWLYWITSGAGLFAWFLIIAFVPETRWMRSKEELGGQKLYPLYDGENRPRVDPRYGRRNLWTYIGIFQLNFEWKRAAWSMIDALKTTLMPSVVFVIIINCAFFIVGSGTHLTISFALLSAGIPFELTGVSVIPNVLASLIVFLFGGILADKFSLKITRRNGGHREPEHHLVNCVIPFFFGIAGCFIFGIAAENSYHFSLLLLGSFLLLSGSLTLVTVTNVFIVESYPQWAGPVLNNTSSLKIIITFFATTNVTTWIQERGILQIYTIFAAMLIIISLGLPVLYFTGKRLRMWTSGKIRSSDSQVQGRDPDRKFPDDSSSSINERV